MMLLLHFMMVMELSPKKHYLIENNFAALLPGVFQHVYVFVGAIVCGIEKKCVTLRTETGADQ